MSRQFLGIQIDAVYHTSLVFDGIEYFFGQGIQTCRAGTTHHGKPMEIVSTSHVKAGRRGHVDADFWISDQSRADCAAPRGHSRIPRVTEDHIYA
jgi:hypothetical protein